MRGHVTAPDPWIEDLAYLAKGRIAQRDIARPKRGKSVGFRLARQFDLSGHRWHIGRIRLDSEEQTQRQMTLAEHPAESRAPRRLVRICRPAR